MTLASLLVIAVACGLTFFTLGLLEVVFGADEDRASMHTITGLFIYGGGLAFTALVTVAYVGLGL